MSDFGQRFAELFAGKKQREIAKVLDVTDTAIRNYLAGRVPDADKLQIIARKTGCNLHWLLIGEGDIYVNKGERTVRAQESFDMLLNDRIRELIRDEMNHDKRIYDLGTVDEFDLAGSIKKHDDPGRVLTEWYAFEGWPTEELSIPDFKGWDNLSLDEKVAELKEFRDELLRHIERDAILSSTKTDAAE